MSRLLRTLQIEWEIVHQFGIVVISKISDDLTGLNPSEFESNKIRSQLPMVWHRAKNFNVYERQGLNCKRSKCKGVIRKKTISNRSTFFCNFCQK